MHVLAAVVLAALTSLANAASATLQWHATATAPDDAGGARLVGYLLRRREWLLGMGALIASFLLQAAALHEGELTLVQPLLVLELPFTLLLASVWLGVRLDRREVLGAAATGLGLALLLGAGAPAGGRAVPTTSAWLLTAAVSAAVLAALISASIGTSPVRRAVLLSAAAGVQFAVTALLVKVVTDRLGHGLLHLLTGWPVYAMAAAGILAVLLQQQGFRAGPIAAAKPSTTVATTVASVLLGVIVLQESLRGGLFVVPELAGVALLVAGVVGLARSPLIGQGAAPERPTAAAGRPATQVSTGPQTVEVPAPETDAGDRLGCDRLGCQG